MKKEFIEKVKSASYVFTRQYCYMYYSGRIYRCGLYSGPVKGTVLPDFRWVMVWKEVDG